MLWASLRYIVEKPKHELSLQFATAIFDCLKLLRDIGCGKEREDISP